MISDGPTFPVGPICSVGAGVRYFSDDALNITQILLFSKQQAFMQFWLAKDGGRKAKLNIREVKTIYCWLLVLVANADNNEAIIVG